MKLFVSFLMVAFVTMNVVAAADDGMAAAREALLNPKAKTVKTVAPPVRDTVITAKHMEYNSNEGVAILTKDVVVDDMRFHLTCDKLFVFMNKDEAPKEASAEEEAEEAAEEVTTVTDEAAMQQSFSRIVCLGNVHVKSETRTATCEKAVYTKSDACLIMVGKVKMTDVDAEGKKNHIMGDKVTIWTEEGRVEIYPKPKLQLSPGASKEIKGLM